MTVGGSPSDEAAGAVVGRPNVVVITTDDQDLRSMQVMTKTRRLLGATGTTFRNAVATTPLCCPSRATFLTGQYSHNHRIRTNGGYYQLNHSNTLPVWLHAAGYRTAHIGRYLNRYGRRDPTERPPGWDRWFAPPASSAFRLYDYTINDNGRLMEHGSAPEDYQTDVYARQAADFIVTEAASPKPFFMWVAPLAPHLEGGPRKGLVPNPRAAPRHVDVFSDRPFEPPDSFNERNVFDKPSFVRLTSPLSPENERMIAELYRDRLESLLAVDDLVQRIVSALEQTGQLDNTVIVFTSDNGYMLGEHRLVGKRFVYEESARVPLLVRGPGVPAGAVRNQVVGNIDLAPTILDVTGVRAGRPLDGRSLLEVLANPAASHGDGVVLESLGKTNRYSALRTPRYSYVEHGSGERELYDLSIDSLQLKSRHAVPDYRTVRRRLAARLSWLDQCTGVLCRSQEPRLRLSLTFDRSTHQGERCTDSAVHARVFGRDPDRLVRKVVYRADGRIVGRRRIPPYDLSIARADLRRTSATRIAARAGLPHDRALSFRRSVPRTCP